MTLDALTASDVNNRRVRRAECRPADRLTRDCAADLTKREAAVTPRG